MDIQIPLIPTTAPSPIDLNSWVEIAVPDGASATGYTTCKVKIGSLGLSPAKTYRANLKQSGTSAPTATELINSTGITPTFSRTGLGVYKLTFVGAFPDSNKLSLHSFINGEDGRNTIIPVHGVGAIKGYYSLYYSDVDSLLLKCYDDSLAAQEMNSLLGGTATNLPIEFTIFP